MWYVNWHGAPNLIKAIETMERAKKEGIKKIIEETQSRKECRYVFTDRFEYNGEKLDTDTMKAYKTTHGKLKVCIIR